LIVRLALQQSALSHRIGDIDAGLILTLQPGPKKAQGIINGPQASSEGLHRPALGRGFPPKPGSANGT